MGVVHLSLFNSDSRFRIVCWIYVSFSVWFTMFLVFCWSDSAEFDIQGLRVSSCVEMTLRSLIYRDSESPPVDLILRSLIYRDSESVSSSVDLTLRSLIYRDSEPVSCWSDSAEFDIQGLRISFLLCWKYCFLFNLEIQSCLLTEASRWLDNSYLAQTVLFKFPRLILISWLQWPLIKTHSRSKLERDWNQSRGSCSGGWQNSVEEFLWWRISLCWKGTTLAFTQ